MLSLWQKESFLPHSDLLVIGAGLTGLLSAIAFKRRYPHRSVTIAEAGSHPLGASVKNAGFACFGSVSEILDDLRNGSEEETFQRVAQRYRGLKLLLETVDPRKIGYDEKGGWEIFTPEDRPMLRESLDQLDYINDRLKEEIGFAPYSLFQNNFGFKALDDLIHIKGEGALHSGKLLTELIRLAQQLEVRILFGTEVSGFSRNSGSWETKVKNGYLTSSLIAVCTNGFTAKLLPDLDIKPARGQIILTSPIHQLNLPGTFHLHQGYYYFRQVNGRILLGGGRHLAREEETTDSQETSETIQVELERILREIILPGKGFTIEERWAGTMGFGAWNEKEPVVSEIEPGLFTAVRLGGMGVSLASTVAAKLVNTISEKI